MNNKEKSSQSSTTIGLCLAVIPFLAYIQVLDYGFLNFDDNQYVTDNPHITRGFNLEEISWAFTEPYASNWHPLTWLSHMFDFQVYGLDPFGHHLTNLILHVANVLLLFLVLNKMTGAFWRSVFVSILFALHPLNVESVAWIAERKNVLSGFFFFLTLWFYTRYSENKKFYVLVFFLLALGLMAKPMLVTLPFLMLLFDFWPLNRFRLWKTDTDTETTTAESPGKLIAEKIPLFILVIISCVITYNAQREGDAVRSTEFRSFYSSAANALVSYIEYLQNMVWPRKLSVFYPHAGDAVSGWKALICGLILVAVTLAVIRNIRKVPYLAVGWFWYLGMLVPVIGLVQVGEQSMADRYTYFPMIGIFICIAWGIPDLLGNGKHKFLPLLAGVFITFLFFSTWAQIKYWENSITLFKRAIEVNETETPSFVVVYNNLGHALLSEKQLEEAVAKFQKAIEINPNYSKPQNNLGNTFSELKRYDEAIEHYRQAIKIEPGYVEAFNNLGNALRQVGQVEASIENYREAIRLDEEYGVAHFNLGIALSQSGNIKAAIIEYRKALKVEPGFVMAHNNLAGLLSQFGDIQGAVRHYQKAIEHDPEFAKAYNNLGSTLAQQGKLKEAIPYFEKAARIDPNYIDARKNLELARSMIK